MSKAPARETRRSRKAHTVLYRGTYDLTLQWLINSREEAGLSQRKVCDLIGMPQSFLSKREAGDLRIDVMEFLQLARLYGKPLELFSGELKKISGTSPIRSFEAPATVRMFNAVEASN